MPSKAEFYRQMAEQVSTRLVGSWKEWTAFLTTAARLYKYPFHEQMMIYAQRPDATACAEYDLWNEKMGRYVRRGTKGIALVDDSSDKPRLRYVFDISDTGTREHSRTPWLWQLEEQHIGPVSAMLERNYGVAGDDLAQQLTDVAGKLASEYWDEHQQDFRYIVDGSFLAEYDAVPGMGHACGHNLMAAMSAGAGIAVKSVLPQLKGSISVFGTPAEEGGGGKVIMLENGAFNGVDAAMIIHSANETVVNDISYSRTDIIVDFFGKGAHAATWPEEGVSALDPLLLLFQHISQMRLRWNGQGTILGIISEGGEDPIHIPEHCQGKFTVRSFSMKTKKKLLGDFLEACEAAARMTGTTWQWKEDGYTYEDIRNNPVIEDVLAEQFTRLGETVMPRRKELGIGCTDVGNLTHAFPALQSYVQVVPLLRGHTKEFEDACKSPDGHRAALTGAKALAMTAVELLSDDSLMEQVDRAFQDMKKQYE